jgi:hypothetical protein
MNGLDMYMYPPVKTRPYGSARAGSLRKCAHNVAQHPAVRKAHGKLGMTEEGFWKRHKAFFDEKTLRRRLTCISRKCIPENVDEDPELRQTYAGMAHYSLQHYSLQHYSLHLACAVIHILT